MIELENAGKRFGRRGAGVEAVRDITLEVPRSAIWAVVGPNGAGKSTLLSLILGFTRPTSGRVSIAGDRPRDWLRDHGAGYLPERFGLPGSWTVRDALRMFARLAGRGNVDADTAIERLGLAASADRQVHTLSRGTLQRVGIAQALLTPHELIVLDEPTEGLDPIWRVRLRDMVRDLGAESRTVLIASHDLAEVERVAHRVVVLDRGSVRDVIDVHEATAATRYRIVLAAPFDRMHEPFPDPETTGPAEYVVTVGNHVDLNQRIAALIELGGLIASVEPLRHDLEQRVRDALDRP